MKEKYQNVVLYDGINKKLFLEYSYKHNKSYIYIYNLFPKMIISMISLIGMNTKICRKFVHSQTKISHYVLPFCFKHFASFFT